jgi:hypothetical protein
MTVSCPPPPPVVIYEEWVRSGKGSVGTGALISAGGSTVIFSARTDSVAAESKRMQIADGLFACAETDNVIPMRAPDPSLKKKSRTERMSRLEREYRW